MKRLCSRRMLFCVFVISPCSTVVSTPSARNINQTLYWMEEPVACPKPNLTLVTIDSFDSCLWFSYPVLANRSEASRTCTSNGGHLISVRSLNKLVALRNSTFNNNLWYVGFLWIGLMFDTVNKTYYWDDDGSEINSDWQIEFFKNAIILSTNDTCVSYYANIWNSALRYDCNMNFNYACEIYV